MGDIPAPQSNHLWSRSRGICARPGCGKALVVVDGTKRVTVGERAHIRSELPGGPRYDAGYGDANVYENLILLCLHDHTLIDSAPQQYPVELLEQWKADHEGPDPGMSPMWLLPPPLSPRYRRRPELSAVLAHMAEHSVTVLAGLAGAGKTQLASDLFGSAEDDFSIRAWLRASDPTVLADDYASLAPLLNVPPRAGQEDAATFALRVRAALEASSGWLLVFDDAPDAAAVARYCPSTGGASLVTTQAQGWMGGVVPLGPMPREDSVELLATNTAFADDPESTSQVADLLGDLPLALTQALGYVSATGMSAVSIATMINDNVARLMAKGEPPDHAALRAVVESCIDDLTDGGRSFLLALAHVAAVPLPVPVPWPVDNSNHSEATWQTDALELEDAIADLRRFSLVDRDDDQLAVHGLIQAVARAHASDEATRTARFDALFLVASRLPERVNREDHIPAAAALLPHALAITDHLKDEPDTGLFTAHLLNRLAPLAALQGDQSLEEQLFTQALELARADSDPDRILVGSILSNLSNHAIRKGDLPGAIALAREALDEKRAGGAEPLTLAITIGALGTHLEAVDPTEALRHFKEATALLVQTDSVRDLAESHADEARVLHSMGRVDEARDAAQQSLEIAEAEPDAWSERSAAHVALANLTETDDLRVALDHARSAVREAESCGLVTHRLAIALSTRGRLRGYAGESAEAVADLRASCDALLEAEGESPDYALSLGNLGGALVMLGREAVSTQVAGEGLSALRRSHTILLAAHGPRHPITERASVMLEQALNMVLGIDLNPGGHGTPTP